MKKITLACLFSLVAFGIYAQSVTSLAENFNVACVTSSGYPTYWLKYNPIPGTASAGGAWTCTPTDGRPTTTGSPTPGIMCTSVYGTPSPIYNLDTSYLITPLLYLHSYATGHVYLHFDSKVSNITLGGRLHIIKATDSNFHSLTDTDITASATPVIGNSGDSSNWVTHEIDLTRYEGIGVF